MSFLCSCASRRKRRAGSIDTGSYYKPPDVHPSGDGDEEANSYVIPSIFKPIQVDSPALARVAPRNEEIQSGSNPSISKTKSAGTEAGSARQVTEAQLASTSHDPEPDSTPCVHTQEKGISDLSENKEWPIDITTRATMTIDKEECCSSLHTQSSRSLSSLNCQYPDPEATEPLLGGSELELDIDVELDEPESIPLMHEPLSYISTAVIPNSSGKASPVITTKEKSECKNVELPKVFIEKSPTPPPMPETSPPPESECGSDYYSKRTSKGCCLVDLDLPYADSVSSSCCCSEHEFSPCLSRSRSVSVTNALDNGHGQPIEVNTVTLVTVSNAATNTIDDELMKTDASTFTRSRSNSLTPTPTPMPTPSSQIISCTSTTTSTNLPSPTTHISSSSITIMLGNQNQTQMENVTPTIPATNVIQSTSEDPIAIPPQGGCYIRAQRIPSPFSPNRRSRSEDDLDLTLSRHHTHQYKWLYHSAGQETDAYGPKFGRDDETQPLFRSWLSLSLSVSSTDLGDESVRKRWTPSSSPSPNLSLLSYECLPEAQNQAQQQPLADQALDLASQSNVQDAFVIAVEQQARERLEKLSALKKIKPVDMTKLSHQLSEAPSGSGDTSELNGLIEAATGSPIYVTSAAELSSSQSALHRSGVGGGDDDAAEEGFDSLHQQDISQQDGIFSSKDPSLSSPVKQRSAHSSSPAQATSDSANGNVTVVSTSSNKKLSPLTNGHNPAKIGTSVVLSASGSGSSVVTVSDVSKFPGQHHQPNKLVVSGTTLPNGQFSITSVDKTNATAKKSISKESVNSKKTSSRENIPDSFEVDGAKAAVTSGKTSKPQSQNSSRESIVDSAQYANMINMVEWDNGPHREMAVDVPDTFVPRNKTPPRYPPTNKSTTLNSNNNKTPNKSVVSAKGNGTATLPGHSGQNGAAAGKPIPPPRISEKDGWSVNNNNTQAPHVPPRTLVSPDKSAEVSPSRDQAERIRKYQEELKKRREHEEKQAKEEEFLRASLRGSKKLQALESRAEQTPSPSGFVNDAYDEEEHRIPYNQSRHGHETTLEKTVGLSELVTSLQRVQQALKKNGLHLDETVSAVGSLMQTPEFQQVLAVHNKVQDVWCFNPPPTPISAHAHQLVQEVRQCMGSLLHCSVPESAELVDLLSRVDLEGVLYAHDKIAERERLLLTIESPLNLGESVDDVAPPKTSRPAFVPEPQPDAHIKVVRIEKTQDPLGATVRNEGEAVVIGRIVKGGAAERSGLLHEGDEVLEVNGIEMRGKSVNEVCDILSRMTGTLTFLIVPSPSPPPPISQRREILIHVRAHFDYDPEDDIYVPCRELGIAFGKGDVLHVISQDDPNWWQAHREGEEDQALAGLIPSKFFQEQREAVKQTLLGETETREKTKKGTLLCAKTHKKKKKKIPYSTAFNDEFDADEIPTYEEVALYYPRASFKRPVVLIGPPNIGRHELRQRLMHESDRFAAAVPHTSRTKKDQEVDGQDYHFITRAQFESDILARKFVEHGEFEKAYYGTSLDAIQSVVNIGKICVLNLHPQSLKILRTSNLKPYIVFVAPPPLERLKQMRISRGEAYKEEELIDIIEKAREMEEKYGHFFDLVIVNNDIERTYHELIQRINYIEREPQWVPAVWLKQ